MLHVSISGKKGRIEKKLKLTHNSVFDKYSTRVRFYHSPALTYMSSLLRVEDTVTTRKLHLAPLNGSVIR